MIGKRTQYDSLALRRSVAIAMQPDGVKRRIARSIAEERNASAVSDEGRSRIGVETVAVIAFKDRRVIYHGDNYQRRLF